MKRSTFTVMVLLLLTLLTAACKPEEPVSQNTGLATLARHVEGYAQAKPGQPLVFPQDHGSHPDFRIEWWYLTANLQDPAGNTYGAQWTMFRLATQPPEANESSYLEQRKQMFMAHFAITTLTEHMSFQRYSRAGGNTLDSRAGVIAQPFSVWLDDWVLESTGADWLPLEVRARQGDYALSLLLQSEAPLIRQGDAGFSQKHPNGGGSYYYSHPFLQVSGELEVDGQKVLVTGDAWLDREWSSQFLQPDQVGWDWFSIHLDSGEKLMLFQLRQQSEQHQDENFLQGSLIAIDGSLTRLNTGDVQLEISEQLVVENRLLPLHWHVSIPKYGREFSIKALHPDQWMNVDFPYWEGAVIVSGNGPENGGRGYMELTGYPIQVGK
jgi:predicted secreted hydrolase